MISNSLPQAFNSLITLGITFASMIVMSVPMTILSIVMALIMAWSTTFLGKRSRKHFRVQQQKLAEVNGDLTRASVNLAKEWRMDRALHKLEAMILATDGKKIFLITGTGDVLEPEYDAVAIGSGGNYAVSAARAYLDCAKDLSAKEIALKSLQIASSICIYTDTNFTYEEIG